MELRERLLEARESLEENPARVVASSMGVFWASAAILIVLAWGTGFREAVRAEFSAFGEAPIFLRPSLTASGFPGYRRGLAVEISREDASRAEREAREHVEAVLPEHRSPKPVLVQARGRARYLELSGMDPRFPHYRNFRIAHGRFFSQADVDAARTVSVLGHTAAEHLFGAADAAVGRSIRIQGSTFEVVGVSKPKGRQYVDWDRPDDRLLMVPMTSAERWLEFPEERVSILTVYPRSGADRDEARRSVVATLARAAHFHPDDDVALRWSDRNDTLGLADLFYAGFLVFTGLVGTITLLLTGLGIANYQLSVVAERAVEIAVARSIGARTRTLMIQTALESAIVASGMATLGVLFGLAICGALRALSVGTAFPPPLVSPVGIAITVSAAIATSVLSSLVPALYVRRIDISLALRGSL